MVEFGAIGAGILLIWLLYLVVVHRKNFLKLYSVRELDLSYFSFAGMTTILFVFFLCFFENYLESSASIAPGLLLYVYFSRSLRAAENVA